MQLSARRSKFVDEYTLDHNGSRAARAAGYAESSAHVTSSRLLRIDKVKAAIELKQHEIATQYEISKHTVVAELMSAIDLAKTKLDPASMIRAWVEIGKILGHYVPDQTDVSKVSKPDALKTKLEALSDEELSAITCKPQPKNNPSDQF